MKIKVFYIFLCLFALNSSIVYSQEIFYPEIEKLLSENQKMELEKSVNILLKARGNENNANDIERKYYNLKKKGKTESYMVKTWEAKQQRIMAEKNYKIAYQIISDVYSELISKGKYENNSTKSEAMVLDKKATSQFEDANSLLDQYSETTKEMLEQVSNESIDSILYKSHTLKLNGIELQIAALQKITDIGLISEAKTDDETGWNTAKKANNISAYYEYLNKNPRGQHVSEANELIANIEKSSRVNDIALNDKNSKNTKSNKIKNQDNPNKDKNGNEINDGDENQGDNQHKIEGNLSFKVQIAAAKTELSAWMLGVKAPGIKNIETLKAEGWIKYIVGNYGTYHEAAAFRDEIRSHTPDAFIVVFSNGEQIQVTEEMKK